MRNRASASASRARAAQRVQELEHNVRTEASTVETKKEQRTLLENKKEMLQMDNALTKNQIMGEEQRSNQGRILEGQLQCVKQNLTIEHQLQLSGSSDISQDVVARAEAEYHSILQRGDEQARAQTAADLIVIGASRVAPPPSAVQGQPLFFPPQYPPRPDDPPAPFQVAPPPSAVQGQPLFFPPQYHPRPDDPPAPFEVAPPPSAVQGPPLFFPPQYPLRPDDPPAPFEVAPPPSALQGQPSFPPQYPPRPNDPPAPFQVAPPLSALQGQPSFFPPQYPPRPDDPLAPFQVAPPPFALQGQPSFFPPEYPPRPDDPPAPFQVPLSAAPLPGMLATSGPVMPRGPGDVLVYAPPFNPRQPMATINQQITMPQQEEMRGGNAVSELEEVNVLTANENNDLDLYIQRAQAQAGPQVEPDNIASGDVDYDVALRVQQLEAVLQQEGDAAAEQEGGADAADQEN